MDIRSGKRARTFWDAIFAWVIGGAGIGIGAALLFSQTERVVPILTLIGGLAGAAVGLSAEWGTSRFAKVLALPGMLLSIIR
jgi:hypothetical protein